MKICEEMVKLREGLDKRNILWADATTYAPKEYIEHMMKNGFTEAGLLELRIDDNNPQG